MGIEPLTLSSVNALLYHPHTPLTSLTVASSKKTHLEDFVWKAKEQ